MEEINLSAEEKRFISDHQAENVQQLILRHSANSAFDIKKLAVQIAARQRIRDKLPTWAANADLVFPATVSVEQSSSEQTARYKARVIQNSTPDAHQLIDGTGGLGVDTWAMAGVVKRVTYVERNSELVRLAAHNLPLLGVQNVTVIHAQTDTVLHDLTTPVDWLYFDPARRDSQGGRVVQLDVCEPNVVGWWGELMTKTNNLLLKTSPLIDIEATLRQLPGVWAVHVVAVGHEVKEVLFVARPETIPAGDVLVTAIDLTTKGEVALTFRRGDEQSVAVAFEDPRQYLYEPNAALLKAGAFRTVAHRFGLAKLAAHSHLYTSDGLLMDFPGRTFRLEAISKPNRADIQHLIPGMKANLTVRNFPQSVEELRKKLGLKEGGDVYVLATTLQNGDKRLLVTAKQ